jgi:membrane protein implicated in regulation of membrane protease activity
MQTKLSSFKESLINIAIGFCVALLAQMLIFPRFGFNPPLHHNLAISGLFTAVSLARSYAVRRWFNRNSQKSYTQLQTQIEQLAADKSKILQLIKDDAWACTFQTMGQYRTALIKIIRETT